jgi:prepilin-type N-terminal cleavage/methylation domain-containing protein
MRRSGFTILELLVTLLVVSVVAAVTIPAFFRQPVVTLENAAVLLARDFRAAQNRSAYLAVECRFQFTDDGQGYRVTGSDGDVVENPATALPFTRRYSEDGVFDGVEVVAVECGGDRTLVYDILGRATESIRVTLAFEGDIRVIEVTEGKGDVAIVGSTSDWVDLGY